MAIFFRAFMGISLLSIMFLLVHVCNGRVVLEFSRLPKGPVPPGGPSGPIHKERVILESSRLPKGPVPPSGPSGPIHKERVVILESSSWLPKGSPVPPSGPSRPTPPTAQD
ncbi:hypothetical protein QQ045_007482 [Rhodiola kirilowii]